MRTEQIADFFAIQNGNELERMKNVRWSFYRYWLDIYREDFYSRVDHVQQDYKVIKDYHLLSMPTMIWNYKPFKNKLQLIESRG